MSDEFVCCFSLHEKINGCVTECEKCVNLWLSVSEVAALTFLLHLLSRHLCPRHFQKDLEWLKCFSRQIITRFTCFTARGGK